MVLRLVKDRPADRADESAAGRPHAVFFLIDGRGGVVEAAGWERLSADPPPSSFDESVETENPIVQTIAGTIAEARAGGGPATRGIEISQEKIRIYAITAAPMPGRGGARFAVTVAEAGGPRPGAAEGKVIRQLGHDLRTPLTSISGAVELLQSGRLGGLQPQQERVVSLMQKGVEGMVRLIDESTAAFRKDGDLLATLGLEGGGGEDDPLAEPDGPEEQRGKKGRR
jgi:His Kinase A (phospho-acceptor) domain